MCKASLICRISKSEIFIASGSLYENLSQLDMPYALIGVPIDLDYMISWSWKPRCSSKYDYSRPSHRADSWDSIPWLPILAANMLARLHCG